MSSSGVRLGCGGAAGRVLVSLFFATFLFAGLFFLWMVLSEGLHDLATWRWREATARIGSSRVEVTQAGQDPYHPVITFRYRIDGREYKSNRIRRRGGGYDSWDAAQQVADRYPVGAEVRCWLDPEHPDQAVLERSTPWLLMVLPVPLIFVIVGGCGLIAVWRRQHSAKQPRPFSAAATRRRLDGRKIIAGVGLLLTIGGGVGSWFLLVRPVARLLAARGWGEVECTVVSSRVRTHEGDDGDTYSVDILYEYRWQDRTYRSSRYLFLGGSSSGAAGKREVVAHYPAGSRRSCWVDPDDPSRAVLDRGFHAIYLVGLVPLAAMAGGALMLRFGAGGSWSGTSRGTEAASTAPTERRGTPAARAVGLLAVTLFWNGIVAVFLVQVIDTWRHGHPDWFLSIFLIPFVLVGLGLLAGTLHAALAVANPRVVLRLAPPAPRLGDDLAVEWTVIGRAERIAHLSVTLEGRERATFSRGTDTVTEHQVFARLPVAEASSLSVARGGASVRIPDDTMHSFSAVHNGIEWRLLVRGEIPHWPDVADDHVLKVRPLAANRMVDPRKDPRR
jgi:hypothetical protein